MLRRATTEQKIADSDFGPVYLVETERLVFVKKVIPFNTLLTEEEALRGVEVYAALRHPNIVNCLKYTVSSEALVLHLSYCSGGTLKQFLGDLAAGGQKLSEIGVAKIFFQLLNALLYLRFRHAVHCDIRSSGILLTRDKEFALGNLSSPTKMRYLAHHSSTSPSLSYFAPEAFGDAPLTDAVDAYALGCVLFELCSLAPPFYSANLPRVAPDLPPSYSAELVSIYTGLLYEDASRRMTVESVSNSSYFTRMEPICRATPLLTEAGKVTPECLLDTDSVTLMAPESEAPIRPSALHGAASTPMSASTLATLTRLETLSASYVRKTFSLGLMDQMKIDWRSFSAYLRYLSVLHCPYVLLPVDVRIGEKEIDVYTPYLLGGSLADLLHSVASGDASMRFNEYFIAKVFCELLEGICFLHSHGVVHRELTPDSVLFVDNHCVLGGLCSLRSPKHPTLDSMAAAPYRSPEAQRGEASAASDVYSLGAILYELCNLKRPPPQAAPAPSPSTPLEFSSDYSAQLRLLVESLLRTDPETRPTSEELVTCQLFVYCRGLSKNINFASGVLGGLYVADDSVLSKSGDDGFRRIPLLNSCSILPRRLSSSLCSASSPKKSRACEIA